MRSSAYSRSCSPTASVSCSNSRRAHSLWPSPSPPAALTFLPPTPPAIDVVATCTAPGLPPRHVSLAGVDGSRPVSELLELIGAQLEEGPSLRAPWRVSLAFSDSSDETARQNFARESDKIEAHFGRKFRASVEGDADGAYLQTPPPTQLHCWQESEWAGPGPSAAQLRVQRAAYLRLGQPGQPPERLVLVVPCRSAGAELVRSLYTYLKCSTGSGSGSKSGNSSAQAGIFGAVSRSAVAAAKAASAWRPSARSLALERIADLDRRIGTLRKELQGHAGGMKITREIDAIQEDVTALQRQITALRRSHINWFYFF